VQLRATPLEDEFQGKPDHSRVLRIPNTRNASSNGSPRLSELRTFQFEDGYYFTLSVRRIRRNPRISLSAARHEAGRCIFDRRSGRALRPRRTEDNGTTNKGFHRCPPFQWCGGSLSIKGITDAQFREIESLSFRWKCLTVSFTN
jgi:hypothetical protein